MARSTLKFFCIAGLPRHHHGMNTDIWCICLWNNFILILLLKIKKAVGGPTAYTLHSNGLTNPPVCGLIYATTKYYCIVSLLSFIFCKLKKFLFNIQIGLWHFVPYLFVIIKVNRKYSRSVPVKILRFSIPEHTVGSDFTISSTLLMSALLKMNNPCYSGVDSKWPAISSLPKSSKQDILLIWPLKMLPVSIFERSCFSPIVNKTNVYNCITNSSAYSFGASSGS